VLLAIKPHNTKLFYELHASSLVCLTRKSGSMARPLVPHGALTNTGIWPKSWRAISREYDVSGPLTLRASAVSDTAHGPLADNPSSQSWLSCRMDRNRLQDALVKVELEIAATQARLQRLRENISNCLSETAAIRQLPRT